MRLFSTTPTVLQRSADNGAIWLRGTELDFGMNMLRTKNLYAMDLGILVVDSLNELHMCTTIACEDLAWPEDVNATHFVSLAVHGYDVLVIIDNKVLLHTLVEGWTVLADDPLVVHLYSAAWNVDHWLVAGDYGLLMSWVPGR